MKTRTQARLLVKYAAVVIAASQLWSLACALSQPAEVAPPVFSVDLSGLEPEAFPAKISELEDVSQTHSDPQVRARALYYLALACLHFNNPQPDYIRAINSLDHYISLGPSEERLNEIVAWKSILKSLDSSLKEYETLMQRHALLTAELQKVNKDRSEKDRRIRELDQALETQKKDIAALQEKIRKLDALHREIQKKKKKES